MTVFTDTTGWREELKDLREGPAYKRMYPTKIRDPKDDPLVPMSAVLDFAETLLSHAETRNALLALAEWHAANPPEIKMPDPENDPTFPHKASNLLNDFLMWFMLKTGMGPRVAAYIAGLNLADLIIREKIERVRCERAVQYLNETARIHLDASR